MPRWQAGLILVTGLLIILCAIAHTIAGWPQFGPALTAAAVSADLVQGLRIGWYFGSTCFMAIGVITLLSGLSAWHSGQAARLPLAVVAVALFGFGAVSFVVTGYEAHCLLFVLLGLGAGVSALPIAVKPRV